MHKLYKKLIETSELLCAIIVGLMGLIVVLQVVLRMLGSGFGWSEELARYMLVWVTMIGAGLLIADNSDVRIELFINKMPKKLVSALNIINNLLILIFAAVMIYFGWKRSIGGLDIQMVSMKVNMMWFYLSVPIGGLLMAIHLIFRFIPNKND